MRLAANAPEALVEVFLRVVNRHDHRDELLVVERHWLIPSLPEKLMRAPRVRRVRPGTYRRTILHDGTAKARRRELTLKRVGAMRRRQRRVPSVNRRCRECTLEACCAAFTASRASRVHSRRRLCGTSFQIPLENYLSAIVSTSKARPRYLFQNATDRISAELAAYRPCRDPF